MKKRTKMSNPQLLSAKELRRLAEEALDTLYDDEETGIFQSKERSYQIATSIAALRFCAANAATLKEVSLLPSLIEAIEALGFYNDEGGDLLYVTLRAIKTLLPLAPLLPKEALALVSHRRPEFRAALAEGLPATNTQALELLEVLAIDSSAEVRGPAQRKLSSLREIPWWAGKFSSDPLALLGDEDKSTLKPILEDLCKLLDLTYASKEQSAQVASLAEKLPEALLFALARRALSDFEQVRGWQRSLLGVILRRPGGCPLVWELMSLHWSNAEFGFAMGYLIADVMGGMSSEARASICLEFLDYLSAPEVASAKHKPQRGVVDVIVKSWPSEVDPSPILEAILLEKISASGITELFKRQELNIEPVLDRFVEAHAAGYPGAWNSLSTVGQELISRAPIEVLQRAVALSLNSENDELALWGLRQRINKSYDEQHDPPRYVLMEQLFAVPRYRTLIYKDIELRPYALPLLRRELVSKPLSFSEASNIMRCIDGVYGGLEFILKDLHAASAEKQEKRREELELFFGPEALRGPASEAEWRCYRALREPPQEADNPEARLEFWSNALHILPSGPLPPEDKTFLQGALQRRESGERIPGLWLGFALALDPLPEYLPFLEKVATEKDQDLTKRIHQAIEKLRGPTTSIPTKETTTKETRPIDWIDEDD
jgi:hypothetical protein